MTRSSLALSVLDLVPVSTDQTSTDAIAASMRTAELADRLGFTRYWFAAHHDMTAFAATTPPVMTALVASRTSRISVRQRHWPSGIPQTDDSSLQRPLCDAGLVEGEHYGSTSE